MTGMTRQEVMTYLIDGMVEHIVPHMKVGVDPIDSIIDMHNQMNSDKQGLRMRIPLMVTIVNQEADAAKHGMSLTGKAPGGSPTAAVKREFGLRKGLRKETTAEVFSTLHAITNNLMACGMEPYELYYESPVHHWNVEYDDGTWCYTGNEDASGCMCAEIEEMGIEEWRAMVAAEEE